MKKYVFDSVGKVLNLDTNNQEYLDPRYVFMESQSSEKPAQV
jgi:hypothetical protein